MSAKVDKVDKPAPNDQEIIDNLWMVRPCQIYMDEFKDCSSMSGRFQQRYIYGETKDCWQWKQDHHNCLQFEKTKDYQHLAPLLAHEKERRKQRLSASVANDVWEYRTEPPEHWMKPIPAKLTETLVGRKFKSKETDSPKSKKDSMCVIS